MYTPVNPSFTIQKWGLRGSKLYRHVFVMFVNGPVEELQANQSESKTTVIKLAKLKVTITADFLQEST